MNKARSDFLFATPTFIYGAARVLDLYGVFDAYNSSSTDYEADYKALWSDLEHSRSGYLFRYETI